MEFPALDSIQYCTGRLNEDLRSQNPIRERLQFGIFSIPVRRKSRRLALRCLIVRLSWAGCTCGKLTGKDMLMAVPSDTDELRSWMVDKWHQYGERFTVFTPDEQPAPDIWEPELPGYDDRGKLNPNALKHWQYLFPTKDFLRHRYAKQNILQGPSLFFDCLVPRFQDGIYQRWAQDQYGQPAAFEVKDDYTWYANAIRMGIFQWQVGFSCRSLLCERLWCKLHRRNPERINPCDVYSLIRIFEDCVPGKALLAVGKWFGVRLSAFESKGIMEKKQAVRYAVSKQAVYDLMARYGNMRHQHVEAFIREAKDLIKASPLVPWHQRLFQEHRTFLSKKAIGNLYRINGPAVKAYLWLLIRQEETARNTRAVFRVSDADVARGLSISRTTAKEYRERLHALGLVTVDVEKTGKKSDIAVTKAKY